MDYFIMSNHAVENLILPIVDDKENVMLFETAEDAHALAEDHPLCQAYGYGVFNRCDGDIG